MDFLLKPISFIFIIFLGYFLKKIKFLKSSDSKIIANVVLCVTLPATVLNAFIGFEASPTLFLIILFGFICSITPLIFMLFISKNKELPQRAFSAINACGFNIGCFALPIIQAFFGAAGTIVACLFDAGNAIIVTGGSYAIVSTVLKLDDSQKATTKKDIAFSIIKKLFSSVPFIIYLTVIVLLALKIKIPEIAGVFLSPIASANSFLAMLMIGLMLETSSDKVYIKSALKIVLTRLVFAGTFSAIFFFLTAPIFDLQTRQILSIVVFAPIASFSPIFTQRCRGDGALSGFAISINVFFSLAIMIILTRLMGI